MVPILAAVLALAAPAAPDCPGDSDKPMVLRCDEAGDRAATVAAARAELRRVDTTPDEREFAVSLGQAALQELYAADNNPEHLCELEELFAEYMATRGADAAAAGHREQAAAARRKDHPKFLCAGEASPASGTSTSPASSPSTTPPASTARPASTAPPARTEGPTAAPRVPPRRAAPRRKVSGMTIGGGTLLVAAAGLGAGAVVLAVEVDELRDRARALRADVYRAGGWTGETLEQYSHLVKVDANTRTAAAMLGVGAGAFAALGVGLVVAGERGRVRRRADVAPYGGAHGAGLVLRGRF